MHPVQFSLVDDIAIFGRLNLQPIDSLGINQTVR
jgi:hypothetical protein